MRARFLQGAHRRTDQHPADALARMVAG